MEAGIYIIINTNDGKVYIGQSTNVKRRINEHRKLLQKGKHKNAYIQEAFKADPNNIVFDVLEKCEKSELDERERYWINYFDSTNRNNGYNLEDGGHKGNKWCKESRDARSGSGNPMFGRNHSKEFIEWIRIHNRASSDKLTTNDVEKIKQSLSAGVLQADLAREYNVTISTINKIAKCKNWEWVKPELNDNIRNLVEERRKAKRILLQKRKEEYDRQEAERTAIKNHVREDFKQGLTKIEIIQKYGISNTTYIRYTTDLYNMRKNELIKLCRQKRSKGMMVKDIAAELGIHRTTVSEYCKGSC